MQKLTARFLVTLFFLLSLTALVVQVQDMTQDQTANGLAVSEPDPVFPDPITLESVTWDHTQGCTYPTPFEFEVVLERAAEEFDIDSRLLSTTIWRESGCNTKALGAVGEAGLTQINPHVWTEHLAEQGITGSLWNMETNLRAGAYVLAYCQERQPDLQQTFRCYNGSGPKAERYGTEQVRVFASSWW